MSEEPKTKHTFQTAPLSGAGVIMAATVLAYLPSLGNGFIWDDNRYVTENPTLQSWAGLLATWTRPTANPQYYPLVFTTFWIEHHLWGVHPLGYHLVNVLLHGLSAVILWRVLRRLGVGGAFLAGMIFAIHPVHVESVAWITERKNVLSGLLYLLAVTAYLRFDPLTAPSNVEGRFDPLEGGRRRWGFYALAAAMFVGALLSKTVTCTLPAALGLVVWWKRPRVTLRDLWPLTPLLAIGTVMGLMTAWLEKAHVGAEGGEWAFSIPQRVLIAGKASWFYAFKLLWPNSLTFIYPRWRIDQAAGWQYVFPASAAAVIAALVLWHHRIGKGPAAGVLFFIGTLFPALGFFNVYPMRFSFVADHFQYLASIGLIALGCASLRGLGVRLGRVGQRGGVVAAIAAVMVLATLTWRQTMIYRSEETLWRDTLTKNFDCWMAHNNLGVALASRGQVTEAIEHYHQALKLKPGFADAHCNLGTALASRGQVTEAIQHYEQALKSAPDFPVAHSNLGVALASDGRVAEAIQHFEHALKVRPTFAEAHFNLGLVLEAQGQVAEAIEHYEQALKLQPNLAAAHYNLGLALEAQGQIAEAIEHYERALKSQPDLADAHNHLGSLLAAQGKLDEAIRHIKRALQLRPDFPTARENLNKALAQRRGGHPTTTSASDSPTRP